LKDCRYGLYMGALFLPLIVLSQAVFPSTRSDDEFGSLILAVYLATFLYYGTAGFLGARRTGRPRDGARIGALTAVVGMALIIATFAAVDNIFLETVSKQVDKIRAFEQSHYVSMRSYINWSLLVGALFMLPALSMIGAALGGLGGLLARRFPGAAIASRGPV
jgi:hypothetical protein